MSETQENKKLMVTNMIENYSNRSPFYYQHFFSTIGFSKNKRTEEIKIQNADVLSIVFYMPKL